MNHKRDYMALHVRNFQVEIYHNRAPVPFELSQRDACLQLLAFPEIVAQAKRVADRLTRYLSVETVSSELAGLVAAIAKAEGKESV